MLTILTTSSFLCWSPPVCFYKRFVNEHLSRPMSGQRALTGERELSHRQTTIYTTDHQHAKQLSR